MNNNASGRRGFSFLSFILGILIGIILVIGSVAGAAYYVLSGKIDDVMNTVGMPNKDEDGNNVYINTDKENGGVETLLELVTKVGELMSDTGSLSVGKVEKLVPAVSGFVDGIHETLAGFVEIDREEFASVEFSALGEFVQEKVLDIEPAKLLDGFGMGGALDNKIVSLIFNGSEAEYVVDESTGVKYPAYYDVYNLSEGKYLREGDGDVLDQNRESNLVPKNGAYRLYYYTANGKNYLTDGDFTFTAPEARLANGEEYVPSQNAKLSGNYYFDAENNKVTVTPVTLRALSDGGFEVLNGVYLTELLGEDGNDLAATVLGGISLGDIMNGEVNFDEVLSNLPLTDLLGSVKVDDTIMVSLVYRVSGVTAVSGQAYTHTGVYKNEGLEKGVLIETEESDGGAVIKSIYVDDADKAEITSITVADLMDGFSVEDLMNDFTVAEFMDVKPEDGIICYLAYGIYGIDANNKTCKADVGGADKNCTYEVDADGKITSVIVVETGEKVPATPINEISGKINGLSNKLTIRELITNIEEGSLLDTLGDYTVNNIEQGINELTIGQIVKNTSGNSLMEALKDVKISELSSKMNDLTVSDVMGKDAVEGNFLLKSLKNTKISELPKEISKLTINELYAEEIYKVTKDENGNDLATPIPAEMKLATEYKEEYIYYEKKGDGFVMVNIDGNEQGKLTQQQFDGTYYTYGKAQGMWEMLLYNNGTENAYALENLTDMVANVSQNMSSSTLNDLHNAGLLKFSDPKDLEKPVKYLDGKPDTTLGELELTEALSYLASLLGNVPETN